MDGKVSIPTDKQKTVFLSNIFFEVKMTPDSKKVNPDSKKVNPDSKKVNPALRR